MRLFLKVLQPRCRFLCVLLLLAFSAPAILSAQTPAFASGITNGIVTTGAIIEASGLAASRQNPGVLWTHNDSGFPGTAFALFTNGALLAQCAVSNVYSGDFEDIAIGPGPVPGLQYIYLGDIGDNFSSRVDIRVFRIPEPAVYSYQSNVAPVLSAVGSRQIVVTYPDGPHNAEALMVDPRTGDLFIATKMTNSCRLYRALRAQLESGDPVELTSVEDVGVRSTSAGDISADGSLIALRRASRADLWVRSPGQSVADGLAATSVRIPVIGQPTEPNGEALAFDPSGSGYYTLSEGYRQPIYFFSRIDSGKPNPPRLFIAAGGSWRYLDDGSDQGTDWRAADFDDAFWFQGRAQFGYGQADEATTLFQTGTTYFRKQFNVPSLEALTNLALRVCFNDGVAVYLNGTEVWRHNLPLEAAFDTPATVDRGIWQNIWFSVPIDPINLRLGTNAIAVETHRFAPNGPDLSFDLQLAEGKVDLSPRFTQAPLLTNGVCRLKLAGPVGSLVTIESSSDLAEWITTRHVILDNAGAGIFEESAAADGSRFYRIATSPDAPN